jgi:hypothetical protein
MQKLSPMSQKEIKKGNFSCASGSEEGANSNERPSFKKGFEFSINLQKIGIGVGPKEEQKTKKYEGIELKRLPMVH